MIVLDESMHPVARDILATHQLTDFGALWKLTGEVVEQGNTGRGGWSRVEKLVLEHQNVTHVFYIKKQHNYSVRTFSSGFRKIPTLLKEQRMINRFQMAKIPTLETAYFGWRQQGNDQQAILVTWELMNYQPLDHILKNESAYSFEQKRSMSKCIAQIIRHMHTQHWMHNCLYPKHIFVKWVNDRAFAALIDLEKTKWVPCCTMAFKRDMDSLNRRSMQASLKTKLYFMHDYFNEHKLSSRNRNKIAGLMVLAKKRLPEMRSNND